MRAEKLYWEEQYVKIAKERKDNHKIIPDLYREYRFYKDKHARLTFLANNLIGDILLGGIFIKREIQNKSQKRFF